MIGVRMLIAFVWSAALLSIPTYVYAHGAHVEMTTSSETVTVVDIHATFDNGTPMSGAQVAVFAPNDPATPWTTGLCDDNGNFRFIPDHTLPGTWEVQVRQSGHGATVYVEIGAVPSGNHASPMTSSLVAASGSNTANFSTLQLILMGASVIWGFIGTGLFFARRAKTPSTHSPPPADHE